MKSSCRKIESIHSLDILKVVMAFLVVSIHIKIFDSSIGECINLVNDIAVPVFFIVSSYLFFKSDKPILSYIKRISILYSIWFIILFPITFHNKLSYYLSDKGLCNFIEDLFFHSTFPNSWYLSASILGTIIVYFLKKYKMGRGSFIIGIYFLYIIYDKKNFINLWYENNIGYISVSFIFSTIFVSIGYILTLIKTRTYFHIESLKYLFILSLILVLYGFIQNYYSLHIIFRVLFSTIIVVFTLCVDIKSSTNSNKFSVMRAYSTVLYLGHSPIGIYIIPFCCKYLNITISNNMIFIITCLLILLSTISLKYLEKKYQLKYIRFIF